VSVAEPRTVSDFPDGFVRSILDVTGCAPVTSIGIESAEVQFSPAGRPKKFLFHPQSIQSESCQGASRALILNSVVGPAALSPKPEWSTLLVLLEPGFLSCLSEPASTEIRDLSGFSRDAIEPPNKLNEIHPAYPPSAREARLPGSVDLEAVITASGCVRDIRTLRSTDTRFALAAIVATSRWRFDPARIEGTPISILFTTTVTFTID
jgi:TonB family protein